MRSPKDTRAQGEPAAGGPVRIVQWPKEQALASVLVDRFDEPVSAEHLIRAVWPDGISNRSVLASRISALRSRLGSVGLEIADRETRGTRWERSSQERCCQILVASTTGST